MASGKSVNPQTFNRYAYTMNRPLILTDSTGLQAGSKREDKFIEYVNYAHLGINNPRGVRRVGLDSDHDSISANSVRFSQRSGLSNSIPKPNGDDVPYFGTEVNAVRHTIWQATITKEFNSYFAKQVGDAHERNPDADTSQNTFTSSKENLENADEVVDILNNRIGRTIGEDNESLTNNEIAQKVIEHFRDKGLYTATINSDGSVSISRTKITKEQADKAIAAIKQLNNSGLDASEIKSIRDAQNRTITDENNRLRRGERPQR